MKKRNQETVAAYLIKNKQRILANKKRYYRELVSLNAPNINDLQLKQEMVVISRKEAASKNMRHYFTGKPCLNGHIRERKTLSGTCLDCARSWKSENKIKSNTNKKQKSEYEKLVASTRQKTRWALLSGKIKREACEVCGFLKVEAHHDDYTKPLSIRWLCKKHHMEHHANDRLAKLGTIRVVES